MSTENIKELKTVLIKTMQDNLQSIQETLPQTIPKHKDNQQIFNFVYDCYKEKQLQVDNLANFILKFLCSLQDVFQQMDFKDKKIQDSKKTILEQSDFILKLQDQLQQYKDKLINAEDYIHWMEEQMQYFDLLSLSPPKLQKQTSLAKCKSQTTFVSSQLFLQAEKNKLKKKIDYERIKLYIQTLKQQKNTLINNYNHLVNEHQRKLLQCQKHSILLDQLFHKYQTESLIETLPRTPKKLINTTESYSPICSSKKSNSQKKLTDTSQDNDVSFFQNTCQHENCSFHQVTENSKVNTFPSSKLHSSKLQYSQSSINEGNSVIESFVSDIFYKHNTKNDVGTNTKKTYLVSTACQTSSVSDLIQKIGTIQSRQKGNQNKLKISQKTTMQESFGAQNSEIKCEISINLKNISPSEIKKIDFSKLISRQVLGQNNQGYSTCHRQKRKQSKHLCQHMYCFLTNKVVTQRIKTYKYARK